MAIVLATASDYLKRTTGLVNCTTGPSAIMGWTKYGTVGAGYRTSWVQLDAPGTYLDFVFTGSAIAANDANLSMSRAGVNQFTTPSVIGTDWFHWCVVRRSAASTDFYFNGSLVGHLTTDMSAATLAEEYVGNDTFSDGDLQLAYVREWSDALTLQQIRDEMGSRTVQNPTNLWGDWPLLTDALDISGNSRDWTEIGSPTYTGATTYDPLVANSTALTAIDLGTLPYSATISSGLSGYFWYSYTPPADQVVIGLWGIASLADSINITAYTGSASAPVYYQFGGLQQINEPVELPVTNGTDYLIQFSTRTALTTDLTISALNGPTEPVPVGSIFINDETTGFPAAAISAADGANYQVLQFFNLPDTLAENGGDVLADGTVLLSATTAGNLQFFNGQLVLQTTIPGITSRIRTCVGAQVFYASTADAGGAILRRITGAGSITDTWVTTYGTLLAAAAQNDESVIYVTGTGNTTPMRAAIKRWDPVGHAYLADLAAGIGGYTTIDLLVTGDDSILGLYFNSSTKAIVVRRYNPAGSTLNTYTIGTTATTTQDTSIFHALDDPTSFWVRLQHGSASPVVGAYCTLLNIRCSDGSILATITNASYLNGSYAASATLTPPARFGVSPSCPAFILREEILPPTPTPTGPSTTEYLIRRERWFPVLNQEQFRMFFSLLQIDLQAGNGITSGQGENPLLELDWSDDGGWTWSNLHLIETGKVGQYTRRAIQRMLGQSRGRVYRIAVSDPVQWAIINGYMQVVLGTS